MKGVIIAAGYGSRLWNVTNNVPKTLLSFGKGTILSTIIGNLHRSGIDEVIIVVGYNQQYIRDYISMNDFDIPVTLVENLLWDKGNALSVYQVKSYIYSESFILSMSDHIVSVFAMKKVVQSNEKSNLLLVDPYIESIFDIDDATKVAVEGDKITRIGKKLSTFNAIDSGIFRLENDFFNAVDEAVRRGNDSISAAIEQLIELQRIKAIEIDKPNQWLDIDTPEAYNHAISKQNAFITDLV